MVELVGGGSDINRATPSSFSVSVLLLASVERFGVSRMRDFSKAFCFYFYCIFILSFCIIIEDVCPVSFKWGFSICFTSQEICHCIFRQFTQSTQCIFIYPFILYLNIKSFSSNTKQYLSEMREVPLFCFR